MTTDMAKKLDIKQLEKDKQALAKEIKASLEASGLVKLNDDMRTCLLLLMYLFFLLQRNNNLQRLGFYKMSYYLFKFLTMHGQLPPKEHKIDIIPLYITDL